MKKFLNDHHGKIIFGILVSILIGFASYFGQNYKIVEIKEQFKADSVTVVQQAEAKIVDTVQVKNREIKSLVAVMKEAPKQVRKVEQADTLLIIKLTPAKDSSRKDTTKQ